MAACRDERGPPRSRHRATANAVHFSDHPDGGTGCRPLFRPDGRIAAGASWWRDDRGPAISGSTPRAGQMTPSDRARLSLGFCPPRPSTRPPGPNSAAHRWGADSSARADMSCAPAPSTTARYKTARSVIVARIPIQSGHSIRWTYRQRTQTAPRSTHRSANRLLPQRAQLRPAASAKNHLDAATIRNFFQAKLQRKVTLDTAEPRSLREKAYRRRRAMLRVMRCCG